MYYTFIYKNNHNFFLKVDICYADGKAEKLYNKILKKMAQY